MKTIEETSKATGGYINPAPLQNIPGVARAFPELLARVQALPFVPAGWTAEVERAMADAGGGLWVPRPAIDVASWRKTRGGVLYDNMPAWLTGDAAVTWNTLCDWWKARLQPILAGWARDEYALVSEAANDAKFWNGLYAVVKPVAIVGEVILAAPEAVASAAAKVVTGTFKALLPVLLIAVGIAVVAVVLKNKLTAVKVG